jgi:hypothetical protein
MVREVDLLAERDARGLVGLRPGLVSGGDEREGGREHGQESEGQDLFHGAVGRRNKTAKMFPANSRDAAGNKRREKTSLPK